MWRIDQMRFGLLLVFATIFVAAAQRGNRCVHSSDCTSYSSCTHQYCECKYGGPIYDHGKLVRCTSFTTAYPAVVPSIVAVLLIILIGGGFGVWYYLRRKKRLERARASTAYIVHTPTSGRVEVHDSREFPSSKQNKKYRSVPREPPSQRHQTTKHKL